MDASSPNQKSLTGRKPEAGNRVDLVAWLGPHGDQHPHARLLAEAWLSWRARAQESRNADQILPAQGDVEPRDMVSALPWVWLWALDGMNQLRLRVVGEEAKRAVGNWGHGSLLEEVVPAEIRPTVVERYRKVLAGPAILGVSGEVVFRSGARVPSYRLILPLAGDSGAGRTAAALIGVTSYVGGLKGLAETGGLRGDAQEERYLALADLR